MRNYTKIILYIIGIGFLFTIIALLFNPWVILPTKSSPHMLTLVRHGGPYPKQIILRHYSDNVHICDYLLDLKIELRSQKPQKYILPQITEGRVEISIELEDCDDNEKTLTMNYEQAGNLYNEGLLIFLNTDYTSKINIGDFIYYNEYVHFVSGEKRKSYCEEAGQTEWSLVTDALELIKFTRKDISYSPLYDGWKENKWVIISPGETTRVEDAGDVH